MENLFIAWTETYKVYYRFYTGINLDRLETKSFDCFFCDFGADSFFSNERSKIPLKEVYKVEDKHGNLVFERTSKGKNGNWFFNNRWVLRNVIYN